MARNTLFTVSLLLLASLAVPSSGACVSQSVRRAYYGIPGGYNTDQWRVVPEAPTSVAITLQDITGTINSYISSHPGDTSAYVTTSLTGVWDPYYGYVKTLILIFPDGSFAAALEGYPIRIQSYSNCPASRSAAQLVQEHFEASKDAVAASRPAQDSSNLANYTRAPTASASRRNATDAPTATPSAAPYLPVSTVNPANPFDVTATEGPERNSTDRAKRGTGCIISGNVFSPGIAFWGVVTGGAGYSSTSLIDASSYIPTLNSYQYGWNVDQPFYTSLGIPDPAWGYTKQWFWYSENSCFSPFAMYFNEYVNTWCAVPWQLQFQLGGY